MKNCITALLLFICIHCIAQSKNGLVSGPWAGNVELRNATVWVEVTPDVKNVAVQYHAENSREEKTVNYQGELGKDFNPLKIELNGLDINTVYLYDVLIDGKKIEPGFVTKFTTKDLWQWRKPAPDFTFLISTPFLPCFRSPVI